MNIAPVISAFDGTVTYTENASPVVLDDNVTVTDVDSVDFATGKLTVSIVANSQSTDVLGIRVTGTAAGQIGVNGSEVSYGGVVIAPSPQGRHWWSLSTTRRRFRQCKHCSVASASRWHPILRLH